MHYSRVIALVLTTLPFSLATRPESSAGAESAVAEVTGERSYGAQVGGSGTTITESVAGERAEATSSSSIEGRRGGRGTTITESVVGQGASTFSTSCRSVGAQSARAGAATITITTGAPGAAAFTSSLGRNGTAVAQAGGGGTTYTINPGGPAAAATSGRYSNSTGNGGGGLVAEGVPESNGTQPTYTINLGQPGAEGPESGPTGGPVGAPQSSGGSRQSFSLTGTAASAVSSGPAQVTSNPALKLHVDGDRVGLLALALGLVLAS